MANPLVLKLEHGAALTDADRARLEAATAQRREIGARTDIIREEEDPAWVNVVLEGYACRYKMLPNGKRSIVAYFLPGDFCDLHVAILGAMDHSIASLTPCTIVQIPPETIEELTTRHPRIARAMWWATLVDESILREWLASTGHRPADKQLAHLFCELRVRLDTVGRADGDSFQLFVTQDELGDTLGITPVHVNRVLQQLRELGLIELHGRSLTIPDVPLLERFAEFKPNYLHLKEPKNATQRSTLS